MKFSQAVARAKKTRRSVYYGYVVVLASALILVVMHGTNASFGVFFSSLQTEFGWDRASISGATSIAFFLMGFFSTIAGRITDRYGPRVTVGASAVILLAGYLLMSQIHAIWNLYIFYGLIVSLGNSGGDMALLPTVARWFVKRRSLMSSLVKAGTGTGIFVMPLVSAWLITSFNWRVAYTVLGIIILVVVVGFSRLLKRDPSEIGAEPYGAVEVAAANHGAAGINLTSREVLATRQFWMLAASYFLIWYSTQSTMVHLAPHGVDSGMSVAQAAGIVSVVGGISIVGRISMGSAGDHIGTRRALILCFVVLVSAMVWLQFAAQPWMLYAFAPLYGFAHGGFFAIVSPLMAEMFGIKAHATNLGLLFFIGMTGGALGPIITGRIYDVNQSYQLAFVIMLAAAAAGLMLALLLKPVSPVLKQHVQAQQTT